jgi:carbamoyl-phosphate synthase small subunit
MSEIIISNEYTNAVLVLNDGNYFLGKGIGRTGLTTGEICFNTSMTGYQEILTDPSYAMQIITFTFPHIGNVGCNANDEEAKKTFCRGLVIGETITNPSNYRAQESLNDWLLKNNICGISGVDTRAITRHISKKGAQGAIIYYAAPGVQIDIADLQKQAALVADLKNVELASSVVSTEKPYTHKTGIFDLKKNDYKSQFESDYKVVVVDYGVKRNILNCLVEAGCEITVVPATTSFAEIKELNPDGIFLSNGPGDPHATYNKVKGFLAELITADIPVFGICMGHQLLSLAFNLETVKMHQGHRGANHPVKNLQTGTVEITSQNHGFCVEADENKLPKNVEITHISLFDRSIEGIGLRDRPIFSVQYHPESSPGPEVTKTHEVVIQPEVKAVVNTITQPVDLGALQMVATDQNLVKNIIVPEVKAAPNLKRFNDIVVNETIEIKEAVNYELVETKVN